MIIEDTYNIQEMLNKDSEILKAIEDGSYYDEEINESDWEEWHNQQKIEAENQFKEFLKHKTRVFDEIVDKYSFLVNLNGESYITCTKMIFYSILSNQLKFNTFTVDNKNIDLRIPIMVMMKAGHGKKNYEYFIKKTIHSLNKQYMEPLSYHQEQFIGKIVVLDHGRDGQEYIQMLGVLASDFVVIDEGKDLLTNNGSIYQETLKYIRTALDPIGDNEVEKKQVNVPFEERLHYCPVCNIVILTQPIANINEELLLRGTFRRFAILVVESDIDERNKARRKSQLMAMKEDVNQKSWNDWIEFNTNLERRKNIKFVGNKIDYDLIDDYIDEIIEDLKDNKEALEYANSIQYNLKFLIFKMSAIRAICEQYGNTVKIDRRHIEAAIVDHRAFWFPQIRWISQQLILTNEKPSGWEDALHGIIMENVKHTGKIAQSEAIERYQIMYQGTYAPNTLKSYAYRGIRELKKWGLIDIETEGKSKILVLKVDKKAKKKINMDDPDNE